MLLDVGAYPVSVIETGSSGHVRYEDRQPLVILNIAKVERAIEDSILSQRHTSSRATCPTQVLQQAGLVFDCAVVIGMSPRRYRFVVSELDDRGHVRYIGT